MSKEIVELALEIIGEISKAFYLTDGDSDEWCPKSQLDWDMAKDGNDPTIGDTVNFYFPEWLANKKGFI